MTPRQIRAAANRPWEDPAVARAGVYLARWALEQDRLRNVVRRPYAVIDGEVRPLTDVVYRDEEAMK